MLVQSAGHIAITQGTYKMAWIYQPGPGPQTGIWVLSDSSETLNCTEKYL